MEEINRKNIKKLSRDILSKNFLKILTILLVPLLLITIEFIIYTFLFVKGDTKAHLEMASNSGIGMGIVSLIMISSWMLAAVIPQYLLLDGVRNGFDTITFGSAIKYLDINLFIKLFISTILGGVIIVLGLLFFIIPGIILIYNYQFYFLELHDSHMNNEIISFVELLKKSKRNMKGKKIKLFIFKLSFFWWYIGVICSVSLLAIYVIPYVMVAHTLFYVYYVKDFESINNESMINETKNNEAINNEI